MKELKELENKIVKKIQRIIYKGDIGIQTVKDLNEYAELQSKLREIRNVMIYLKREMK